MRDVKALAMRLWEAERTRTPIAPFTDEMSLTEDEAYAVQQETLRLRGERPAGFKLGFTSRAMREQMGVRTPNYGILTPSMCLQEPVLDCRRQIHPRIEPEIAVLVERDLGGPGLTPAEVALAVQWVAPALEVVDSRFRDYRFRAVDNIADNSSASRYILGRFHPLGAADLRTAGVVVTKSGRLLDLGVGAAALGDPLEAVRWLANRLGEQGKALPAGSLVLTGGLTRAWPVQPGETVVADFGPLGWVQLYAEG